MDDDGTLLIASSVITTDGRPTCMLIVGSDSVPLGLLTVAGRTGFADVIIDDGTVGNDARNYAQLTAGQAFTLTCKIPLAGTTNFGPTIVDNSGVRDVDIAVALGTLDIATVDTVAAGDLVAVFRPASSQSCVRVSGNANLTVTASADLVPGMSVSGTGITAGTLVQSITDATHVVLTIAPIASGTSSLTFGRALPVVALPGAGSYQPLDADLTAIAALATAAFGRSLLTGADAAAVRALLQIPEVLSTALDVDAISTGTVKGSFRMPFAMTVTAVRAALRVASSSGIPTFDINEGGTTILSTKLTIDASEKTSTTAATPAVISDATLADDAEITVDVDVAGTGAAGATITLIGYRT